MKIEILKSAEGNDQKQKFFEKFSVPSHKSDVG